MWACVRMISIPAPQALRMSLIKSSKITWRCQLFRMKAFAGWRVKNATGVCELEIDSVNWSGSPACAAAYDFRLMSVGEKQLLMKRCGCSLRCCALGARDRDGVLPLFRQVVLALRSGGVPRGLFSCVPGWLGVSRWRVFSAS